MNNFDFLTNPWIVGSGVTVIGGLILYHVFGVGKTKNNKKVGHKKSPHVSAKGNISAGRDIIVGKQTTKTKKKELNKQLTLDFAEKKVSWDKYSVGRRIWPSFRIRLIVNNYKNDSPEYLKASLLANSNDGEWKATNFIFEDPEIPEKSKFNSEYRIEPGYKKKVTLFLSNFDIVNIRERIPMPDVDRDTLRLIVETENGKKFKMPIRAGWIEG